MLMLVPLLSSLQVKLIMRKSLHLFVVLTLLAFASSAQRQKSVIDSLVSSQLSGQSPGGVVLIAQRGEVIYRKPFGQANIELRVPMQSEHVFRIGSITKQFTAAGILKLAQEGKLSLQDTITKFIKEFPAPGHSITIEHLLTHTSGIKNYTSLPQWTSEVSRNDFTPKVLVDFFKDEPLEFIPGTQFRYSNSGYVLLGVIIEQVTGKSYADYVQQNFFQPLNMENSFNGDPLLIIPNRVAGYQRKNGQYRNAEFLSMTLPYSAGSLLSTIDDLFSWNEALMNGKVLTEKSLEMAHTSYKLTNGKLTGYGYGWEIGNVQGSVAIKHTGRINGFVTYAVCLPKENIFVAIFSNCDCTYNLENTASMMAAIVLDKPFGWTAIALPDKAMELYKGNYYSDTNEQKIISFEDGRLLYYNKGGTKSPLLAYKKDKFFQKHELTTLQFERDSMENIIGFKLNGLGLPSFWTRSGEIVQTLKPVNVKSADLEKYTGEYQFSPGPVFSVIREGDRLFGAVGTDKKEIVPYGKHQFFATDLDAKIIFHVDQKGNVISLTKVQNGEMQAVRIK
jgi:CubicO group peptidase (beta-lactamase class C family)